MKLGVCATNYIASVDLKLLSTIVDNRTGVKYEFEIRDDTINATNLANLKSQNGEVLRSFDPAYMNTVCCISKISFIDGDNGILEYRGYPIE